ncbi:MAG: antibiotic biosynthesis monooxygenase [Chloroflexota bacterium]
MFVVMNRIPVNPEYAEAFVARFKDRASLVDNMPGFVDFRLLHPANEDDPFVVETTWESKADFKNWTQSEEFKKGHAQAGRLPNEAFLGHPKLETFEVIQAAKRGEILD